MEHGVEERVESGSVPRSRSALALSVCRLLRLVRFVQAALVARVEAKQPPTDQRRFRALSARISAAATELRWSPEDEPWQEQEKRPAQRR